MSLPLLIIGAVGALAQGIGTILSGNAQADAATKNADFKHQQADELLARQAINEQILRDEADRQKLQMGSIAGGSGLGGSGIGMKLAIMKNLTESISNSRRDAEFKAKMLNAGAEVDTQLASDIQTAGVISGVGTVLTGAYKAYDAYSPASNNRSSLPKVK